ncbi:hypothetical protein Nepgr_002727 [Nepenthes gracilis]|uniref:Uncharacterized protein n=1 Tax=Nepenthes gracilis TaxID=150966 RepID=A0AAD3RYF1_NEPGR|nr:hypothetical protein Nepgr_002727 [Nepenthes gracilis]
MASLLGIPPGPPQPASPPLLPVNPSLNVGSSVSLPPLPLPPGSLPSPNPLFSPSPQPPPNLPLSPPLESSPTALSTADGCENGNPLGSGSPSSLSQYLDTPFFGRRANTSPSWSDVVQKEVSRVVSSFPMDDTALARDSPQPNIKQQCPSVKESWVLSSFEQNLQQDGKQYLACAMLGHNIRSSCVDFGDLSSDKASPDSFQKLSWKSSNIDGPDFDDPEISVKHVAPSMEEAKQVGYPGAIYDATLMVVEAQAPYLESLSLEGG